jgi:hypothetical protein
MFKSSTWALELNSYYTGPFSNPHLPPRRTTGHCRNGPVIRTHHASSKPLFRHTTTSTSASFVRILLHEPSTSSSTSLNRFFLLLLSAIFPIIVHSVDFMLRIGDTRIRPSPPHDLNRSPFRSSSTQLIAVNGGRATPLLEVRARTNGKLPTSYRIAFYLDTSSGLDILAVAKRVSKNIFSDRFSAWAMRLMPGLAPDGSGQVQFIKVQRRGIRCSKEDRERRKREKEKKKALMAFSRGRPKNYELPIDNIRLPTGSATLELQTKLFCQSLFEKKDRRLGKRAPSSEQRPRRNARESTQQAVAQEPSPTRAL